MKLKISLILGGTLSLILMLFMLFNYSYISKGIIKVQNGNSIVLKHKCFVYYQGGNIEPSILEKAFNKNKRVKKIRLYVPGVEQVNKHVMKIDAELYSSDYNLGSLFGKELISKPIDRSSYTVKFTNIKITEVSNRIVKTGGFLEKMDIGKGYDITFDVIIDFKKIDESQKMFKIVMKYPDSKIKGKYVQRNRTGMPYSYMPSGSLGGLVNRLRNFRNIRTGVFKAKFVPSSIPEHPYKQTYIFTDEFYYKVKFIKSL